MTQPEQKLWYYLRGGQLKGYKFRRQYGFLNYILDFYCVVAKLAIEVDGDSHYNPNVQEQDSIRTIVLEKAGIKVLRFTNNDINTNIEGVVSSIVSHLP
jgi:very-short-patch-repair endonuclease